jgi:hypothetical protein
MIFGDWVLLVGLQFGLVEPFILVPQAVVRRIIFLAKSPKTIAVEGLRGRAEISWVGFST